MKTIKNFLIALVIVFGSASLTGCMQNFDEIETPSGTETAKDSNDDQWN